MVEHARHGACGVPVLWCKTEKGRTHAPLEATGQVYIIDRDGFVRAVPGYQIHQCDPDDMKRWEAFKVQNETQRAEWLQQKEHAWEIALRRECPRCGAKKKKKCKNLHDRNKGLPERDTSLPHIERVPELKGDVEV